MKTLERWNSFKRLVLFIFSILMWIMSIVFSYMGFVSGERSEWYFGIFAFILSGAITALELYMNSQTLEFNDLDVGVIILWIGGLFAYAYGIWTNIVGFSIMMIGNSDLTTVRWQSQIVPIVVGLLLEILPEPMFVAFLKSKSKDVQKAYPTSTSNRTKPFVSTVPETIARRFPYEEPRG